MGEEIKKIATRPGSANLAVIASSLVAKYPISLGDHANGQLIGDGLKSLHRRLIKHFENRPNGNSLKKKLLMVDDGDENNTASDTESLPTAKQVRRTKGSYAADSYGCTNWQPEEMPIDETDESQEAKRQWLCNEYKVEKDAVRVQEYMDVT